MKSNQMKFYLFLLISLFSSYSWSDEQHINKKVAITMDGLDIPSQQKIINTFKKFNADLTIFVNEGSALANFSEIDIKNTLKKYIDNNIQLGNHTYIHKDANSETFDEFKEDVNKGETILKSLVKEIKYFRFPFLSTGKTIDERREINKFLTEEKQYTIIPVSIDTIDWKFNQDYQRALDENDKDKINEISDTFIKFIKQIIKANEDWSIYALNRNIKHICLIHQTSKLTIDNLESILQAFKDQGYKFISLENAITDEAYKIDTVDCCSGGGLLYRVSKILNKLDWYEKNKHLFIVPEAYN